MKIGHTKRDGMIIFCDSTQSINDKILMVR